MSALGVLSTGAKAAEKSAPGFRERVVPDGSSNELEDATQMRRGRRVFYWETAARGVRWGTLKKRCVVQYGQYAGEHLSHPVGLWGAGAEMLREW